MLEGDKERGVTSLAGDRAAPAVLGPFQPRGPGRFVSPARDGARLAPHLLTISLLDCEALDVMFGFDFNFEGNHDEVVAEALGVGHGLEGLFELPGREVINYEPSITLALERVVPAPVPAGDRDPDQRLQGPDPRVRRRPDQRLLHGAAVLGHGPGHDLPRSLPPPA